MSESAPGGQGRGTSIGALLIGLIAVVGAGVWVWFAFGPGASEPGPSATPTITVTATPSPSATASATSSGTPDATPTCDTFGTLEASTSSDDWAEQLRSEIWGVTMRVGTHACYDRFVFEFDGDDDMPGWSVTPHDSPEFTADPSGEEIDPLAGTASLDVAFAAWGDGTPLGEDPFEGELVILTDGFPVIQEARFLSAFEGITHIGIGLSGAQPYEVTWLEDPARLVIDVFHG